MPQTSLGGGINNDQLALLGLLGKQVPQAQQSNLGITPQQQAALLNALQVRMKDPSSGALCVCTWGC